MVGQISLESVLTSPDPQFNLRSQNKEFPTQAFDSSEAKLLQSQINDLIAPLPDATLGKLFNDRTDTIALTAAFAKQYFDGKLFGGINAQDNEIGFDVLRPGHIRADPTNGTIQNNWYFTPSSTGWNDWIGDGTSANNYTVTKDQVVLVLGVVDQDVSTELSGVNVQQFGRNVDMIPQDLNSMRLQDNQNELQVTPLPSLIGQENDQVHMRLRYDRQTESEPRLYGFTFGLGSYMNTEDY